MTNCYKPRRHISHH